MRIVESFGEFKELNEGSLPKGFKDALKYNNFENTKNYMPAKTVGGDDVYIIEVNWNPAENQFYPTGLVYHGDIDVWDREEWDEAGRNTSNRMPEFDIKNVGDIKRAIAKMGRNDESVDEARRSAVHKAAKKGSFPAVIVVIEKGKVIHQEPVSTPEVAPATFNVMQEKYPNATIHLEDATGQRLFSESLNEEEKFHMSINFQDSKELSKFLKRQHAAYSQSDGNTRSDVKFTFGDSGSVTAYTWYAMATKYCRQNDIKYQDLNESLKSYADLTYADAETYMKFNKIISDYVKLNYPDDYYSAGKVGMMGKSGHGLNDSNIAKILKFAKNQGDKKLQKMIQDWKDNDAVIKKKYENSAKL